MQNTFSGIAEELISGEGYVILPNFFPKDQIDQARELLYRIADDEPDRASHFHGDKVEKTQKRVWNLPAKGEIFRTLCSDERLIQIMTPIIGDDFMLSSWAANITYPGAPAQECHVDYPYWDLHTRSHWPSNLNSSFFLAVEVILTLDEFTQENGATALVPHSHKRCEWPNAEEFAATRIRAVCPPGTVVIFPALLWHAAQANNSQSSRAALLGSYTTKCVKPIEDWSRCVSPEILAQCSPAMRQLLADFTPLKNREPLCFQGFK